MAPETVMAESVPPAEEADTRSPLQRLLAENPALPIAVLALAAFVFLAGDEGGFRQTTYLPTTLLLLALLAVGLLALPRPSPRPAAAWAAGLLAAYAAWSYLSIVWADQQGMAWDGANRTAMYAIVFALFVLWPVKGRVAAFLLAAYALGIAGVGLVELLRASASSDPIGFFYEGRLSEPTGYANANVALWFTAFFPALVLAGRRELHPLLRGLLLGSANLMVALAILGQSRSWMAALPLMAVLLIAVVPGRARTIVALALVGIGTAAMFGPLLDAYEGYDGRTPPSEYVSSGAHAALLVSALLIFAGVLWGMLDRGVKTSAATSRRLSIAVIAAFAIACVGATIAFTVVEGNPISVADRIVDDFKKGEGEPHFNGSRFGLSASSYRYDYFQVAWKNFSEHPLLGVGSDNYGRQYLRDGDTPETPAYPHNLALRVLSMTGLIGTVLFLGALIGALLAAFAAVRRGSPLGAAAAAAGILTFAYFVAHGMLDWIWEFPALGCAAFAALALGAACDAPARAGKSLPPGIRRGAFAAAAVGAVLLAVALTLPWLADRDLRNARKLAATNPAAALDRLDRAAKLNPLSPTAYTTASVIEANHHRYGDAKVYIDKALDREPGDPFAYLALAAIASAEDRRPDALRLVARSRALSPLDRVAKRVQRQLRRGRFVTPERLNQMILRDVDSRIGPR
jgi:tetratricopeptide (TPR) repeat protein